MASETDTQARKRRQQRLLFDGIAERYDATRRSYRAGMMDTLLTTAQIGPGAAVLEIGCGTGQLTRQVSGRGLDLTVIDIGAALVATATRNVADPRVRFEVSASKTSRTPDRSISSFRPPRFTGSIPTSARPRSLVSSAPEDWLALLSTGERYPEPLRRDLRSLWRKYSPTDGGAARRKPERSTCVVAANAGVS